MAVVFPGTVSISAAAITDIGQFPVRTSVELAQEALESALAQAGVGRDAVDGFVWNLGTSLGANYDKVCARLGLRPGFVVQTWTHGRFTGTSLMLAAMAVQSGAATTVVCLGGIKASPSPDRQAARRPSGGVEVYVRPAARALERYLARYGVDRERLADIVLSARRYGALNPRAFLRGPFTADDYRASPFVLGSLRVADCLPSDESWGPVNDSGVCVVVTRTDESRAARPPVLIAAAQSIQAGPEEVYFGRPGLGEDAYDFRPTPRDLSVFTETGLSPRDVDGFYTYDAFASAVWFALERFGYCGPGEAPSWITQERIWRDGDLPVNTNGGILAAGHTSGWAQVVEMVEQLRGEGGPRQIPGAELLHWGSIFGDSLLLTTNPDHCAGR